jgi:SAM-dependent methyltransferase
VDAAEITRLAALEDRHWWYAARRRLLEQVLRGTRPGGAALDVGAAGGGNTRVLRDSGWQAVAVEYTETGAAICRQRALDVVRGDAQRLPFRTASASLAVAFDVIEHLDDDAAAVAELHRVLRPGSRLVLAVPADPTLWSEHDVAVDHKRRYTRESLTRVVEGAGFEIDDLWSWNVLLKPLVRMRRKSSTGSDLEHVPVPLNAALRAVIAAEQLVRPLRHRPGVSLVLTARRRGREPGRSARP